MDAWKPKYTLLQKIAIIAQFVTMAVAFMVFLIVIVALS